MAGTAGVTVLARDATTAEALSTPCLVVGLKGAENLLRASPSVEVLIVPDKHPPEFWLTPGFARVFTPLPRFSKAVRILNPVGAGSKEP